MIVLLFVYYNENIFMKYLVTRDSNNLLFSNKNLEQNGVLFGAPSCFFCDSEVFVINHFFETFEKNKWGKAYITNKRRKIIKFNNRVVEIF